MIDESSKNPSASELEKKFEELVEYMTKLEEENARFREALKYYADRESIYGKGCAMKALGLIKEPILPRDLVGREL